MSMEMSWICPADPLTSTRAYIGERLDGEGTDEPNLKQDVTRFFRIV